MLDGSEFQMRIVWKETVFKLVFSCAVGLELKFVGEPGYFLLMSDILVRINGHNIVGYFIKAQTTNTTETYS